MLLSQVQIKEEELKLLEISGFGLAEYSDPNKSARIFKELSVTSTSKQLERLKIVKIQSSGLSSNANLKAIVSILLSTIYDNEIKQDLLDLLKSSLYSPSLDLAEIKHHPLGLGNGQMKKLVVQFFYSLSYSQSIDRVESKLSKYPIIMQILVLYLRTLLKQLGLHNAQNYLFRLPTSEVYELIIQYFDLNCRDQGKLYLFFEDRMFILEDSHHEILLGQYIENDNQIRTIYDNRFREIEEIQDNAENQWSKQGTEGFNRSLELRGIVSESIVFQQDTATPFFNFDQDSCTSFQSSKEPSLVGDNDVQKNSLIKINREVSLLKQMDRMTGSQQMGLGGNLSMKRTLMENQFKAKNDSRQEGTFSYGYGLGMTLQSPITLDSPHTLDLPADRNFGQQVDHFQKFKQMKKSKSEKRSKTMPEEKHQDLDGKKEQASHSQKGLKIQNTSSLNNLETFKQQCGCVQTKKQKLKLNSHLYQLNLSFNAQIPDFSKKNPQTYEIPSPTSIFSKSNLVFTRVKSISGLQKTLNEKFNTSTISHKLQQSGKIFPTLQNDQSFSTCSIRAAMNPESETHSRREFSPLSNIDRPLSPYGGSKSITTVLSPKITFNYKNPLKYSVCMRKGFQKTVYKK